MRKNLPADDTYATYLGNTLNRQNNLIAVGGPFLNESNGTFDARYYTFDATTMTMTHAQKFKMYGKASTSGITYLSDYKKLAILHFQNPLNGTYATPVLLLDPFPTTAYTANFFIHPNCEFHCIDKLNYSINNVNHLLLGANFVNNNFHGYQWFIRSSLCGTNSYNPCNEHYSFEVETLDILNPKKDLDVDPFPNSASSYPVSRTPVHYNPNTVQCFNQIRQ